jgi:transposase-like protein
MSKLKDLEWLFNDRHFDREVIVLCVRWYVRYKLSLRDLVEMMAERDLSLALHRHNAQTGRGDSVVGMPTM